MNRGNLIFMFYESITAVLVKKIARKSQKIGLKSDLELTREKEFIESAFY